MSYRIQKLTASIRISKSQVLTVWCERSPRWLLLSALELFAHRNYLAVLKRPSDWLNAHPAGNVNPGRRARRNSLVLRSYSYICSTWWRLVETLTDSLCFCPLNSGLNLGSVHDVDGSSSVLCGCGLIGDNVGRGELLGEGLLMLGLFDGKIFDKGDMLGLLRGDLLDIFFFEQMKLLDLLLGRWLWLQLFLCLWWLVFLLFS